MSGKSTRSQLLLKKLVSRHYPDGQSGTDKPEQTPHFRLHRIQYHHVLHVHRDLQFYSGSCRRIFTPSPLLRCLQLITTYLPTVTY